ncbi:hypothetical protein I7I48_03229 [Histoplasma ohiense]|nr:hypothetical protein I7I48_03229 [Histoplasma ohiense (nom. inval.)]
MPTETLQYLWPYSRQTNPLQLSQSHGGRRSSMRPTAASFLTALPVSIHTHRNPPQPTCRHRHQRRSYILFIGGADIAERAAISPSPAAARAFISKVHAAC